MMHAQGKEESSRQIERLNPCATPALPRLGLRWAGRGAGLGGGVAAATRCLMWASASCTWSIRIRHRSPLPSRARARSMAANSPWISSTWRVRAAPCKPWCSRASTSPSARPRWQVADFTVAQSKAVPNAVYAGSVPYLMLAGNLIAGWQMARALLAAEKLLAAGQDTAFMQAKIATARFYAEHILPRTAPLREAIVEGAASVTALALDAF